MVRLCVLFLGSRNGSVRGRRSLPRLGGGALVAALALTACGDDSDDADDSDDELTARVEVEGCEPGEVSEGDDPGDAPDMPDDPAAALDDALTKTQALTSAEMTIDVDLQLSEIASSTALETAFDDVGVVAGTAVEGVNDEEIGMAFCSDGETAWVHLDIEEVDEALPDGVAWVDGTPDEVFGAGLVGDPETTWRTFTILRGMEDFEDAGTEEIAGVPVRRIEGAIDYEAALAAATDEEAGAMGRIVSTGTDAAITAVAGLDGDGVLRWLEVEVEGQPVPDGSDDDGDDGDDGDDDEGVQTSYRVVVSQVNPSIAAPTLPADEASVPLADVPEVGTLLGR